MNTTSRTLGPPAAWAAFREEVLSRSMVPMIRRERMLHTPQDSLGTATDVDLPADRADVGLHGVGAEVGQLRDLGVALTLGDERQDLRFSIADSFASPGQS